MIIIEMMRALKNLNELLTDSCEDIINDYLEKQDIVDSCPEYFEIIKNRSESKIIKELNIRLKEVDCEVPKDILIKYVLEKISVLAVRFLCEQPYERIQKSKSETRKLTSF